MTDTPQIPVPRTPRAQVRTRLLAAAAAVFAERGYAEAGIAEVAARAGFTKGAVYSNFTSKQGLFAALLYDRSVGTVADALTRLLDEGVTARELPDRAGRLLAEIAAGPWHALITELAVQAGRDDQARAVYADFRRRQREMLAGALRERAGRLGIDPSIDLDRAAFTLLAVIGGFGLELAADPGADQELAAAALSDILRGLLSGHPEEKRWAPRGSNPEPAD